MISQKTSTGSHIQWACKWHWQNWVMETINPFVPNAPFLYPLKTSANLADFGCFQGVEKGCIGNKWINVKEKYFVQSIGNKWINVKEKYFVTDISNIKKAFSSTGEKKKQLSHLLWIDTCLVESTKTFAMTMKSTICN